LQQLFAPWRFGYLSAASPVTECIFCAATRGDEGSLVIWQGERAFALLNRYPYTSGHVMVAPRAHVADYAGLDGETLSELFTASQRVVRAVQEVYRPHGFNVGLNLGDAAGAGIADHLHVHVVPRWRGDTNFMPVVGEVRVIPEDLAETQKKLARAMEGIGG
jgi:ATP adenylyltransferase